MKSLIKKNAAHMFMVGACLLMLAPYARAAEPTLNVMPEIKPETVDALKQMAHGVTMGNGTEVVMVSDPFCVFCRMSYDHLMREADKVGQLYVVHVALAGHPGSDMAGALAGYLAEKGKGREALDLAYRIEQPETKSYSQAGAIIYKTFQERFPEELADMTMKQFAAARFPQYFETAQAVGRLGFKGTPHIIARGRHMNGYKSSWLDLLLMENNK
ncbi:DsbA family protein [Pseudodesulfovibrio senegalensis]|jgi:hypothetical protein|uniref:Thioredoxin domain-containing protein n=1 Tax=Pseudodesulfovibrio senegalensis TaxID=1721087 RepID=A0A6N6N4S3_9BACT|nr:hypothetical protein [Pseudodesulfovibrio senegalensis]KAB1443046.1 hypothetical protein F8A88_01930 [Pseudodesulfovibrio senegalensis]